MLYIRPRTVSKVESIPLHHLAWSLGSGHSCPGYQAETSEVLRIFRPYLGDHGLDGELTLETEEYEEDSKFIVDHTGQVSTLFQQRLQSRYK